ncbi:MAG: DUF2330 domain-containing protein [bacterium]
MKKLFGYIAIWLAFFFMVAVSYEDGESFCVIFPQSGRDMFGVAQRTILFFGEKKVSLIPQVHFEGDARDFGILVPVPAEPRLSTVGANIFTDASFLTQPIMRQSSQGCGCDESDQVIGPMFRLETAADGDLVEERDGDVTVIFEEIVGMFQAVVLQATSADDLVQWLSDNNYHFDPADSQVLEEYVTRNWFFVAMKLDTTQVPPLIDPWWNATTSPAKITFDYDDTTLTYPLKISAISTKERVEVLVYTIGPDPMRFPGAKVEYANEITDDEADAIAERYFTLSQFITPGVFVTKLRRSFAKSEMQQDIDIFATDDRREFRDIRYVNNGGFGFVGILVLALVMLISRGKFDLKK